MAIFEVETERKKDVLRLFRKLNYITDFNSTNKELIYGSAVSIFYAFEEMEKVQEAFDQTEGKGYKHYVLSLEENKNVTAPKFRDVCIQVCETLSLFYGKYQVLMAIHINTDNLHAHFVANAIDYVTGKRFDLSLRRLTELKMEINKILISNHLPVIRMNLPNGGKIDG
jgi:hypothetical protein